MTDDNSGIVRFPAAAVEESRN